MASLLLASLMTLSVPASANTGCPASSNSFGSQTWTGSCTVTSDTTWGNGTLAIAGSITVQGGARLSLWSLGLTFTLSSDEQFYILVDGGRLFVQGGSITSGNPSFSWRLETSTASGSLVDIRNANVSHAGGGSYSSFLLQGGTGHRFLHLAIQSSAVGSGFGVAVIDVAGSGVDNLRVENTTFSGTGSAYYVSSGVSGTNLIFANNQITNYAGNAAAVAAANTQILGNTINVGNAIGVSLSRGGPGWPSKNAYNVSGNTITTTGYAIQSLAARGYDVTWNRIIGGHVSFDGNGMLFAYNNVSGTDERVLRTHVVWTSPNSSFDHNTIWGADLTGDSGFVVINYGNVKVTDNRLFLNCYGDNCMGIEVINVIPSYQAIYPGFPTVEVARNRITWTTIASGGLTIFLDNEYSERVWLHDNVEAVVPGTGTPTSSLQGGGVRDSVYENNTVLGPTTWCIYEYIDSAANNLFQNNRCDRGQYGGIFQTGGNVYRDNTFTNLSGPGIWICPNGPCAGSTTNTTNNAWFNNTFTFTSGTPYLTLMSLSNALYNTFLGHGATHWTDGSTAHSVYGDWLFFTNAAIRHLAWTDIPDGHRALSFSTGGAVYTDQEAVPSVTDRASLALDGSIDYHGSLNAGTVLGSLSPAGTTSLDVTGTGITSFALSGFQAGYTYNVTVRNVAQGTTTQFSVNTDGTGANSFSVDFGSSTTQFHITIVLGPALPGADRTPPAKVTDLQASLVGPTFVVLTWTAPGDNGTQGQASQYDLRYSTAGPIDDTNFASGTRVIVPPPNPAGTTETFNVTGLQPATEYWFALRTADEVPNWSPSSDNAATTTSGSPPPPPPPPPVNPVPPSVTTPAPTATNETAATLSGNVSSLGTATTVDVGFLYGTDPGLAGASNTTAGTLDAPGTFETPVSGLLPGTLYYVEAWAGGQGFAWGGIQNFTTPTSPGTAPEPSVLGVTYTPEARQLDVLFSQPMNQTSLAIAMSISPSVTYQVVWVNASHVELQLGSPPAEGTEYELRIAATALSASGQPMGDSFTFRFAVPAATAKPPSDPWSGLVSGGLLWVTVALAGGCVVAILMYRRSRAKVLALRRAARMLARRIEELNAAVPRATPKAAGAGGTTPLRPVPRNRRVVVKQRRIETGVGNP